MGAGYRVTTSDYLDRQLGLELPERSDQAF